MLKEAMLRNVVFRVGVCFILHSCSVLAFDLAKSPRIDPLKVLESYTLPAVEISGMTWRTNPETKRREIVVVGDRDFRVTFFDWENRKRDFSPRSVDLRFLFPGAAANPGSQSEWESISSDESGRLFIVRESPAEVLIISADLKRLEGRITLTGKINSDRNSGGEGMVLLKNGHLLVVKEKNPIQLLEFASEGKVAEGYRADLSIERGGRFPPIGVSPVSYVPVFTWEFSPEVEALFEDSSGVNLDPAGALYLLGDQKNLVARLGPKLEANKAKIQVERFWSLPSEIKHPEGMVIDSEDRPIISVDRKNTKSPNLFLLTSVRDGSK